MQCEIRGMGEMAEAAQASTDTLPKPGRVNEVCREWLVKEDGALAYRLQTEEIKHHYTGNKSRNALVREDFPRALDEQRREEEEAAALRAVYHQMVRQQEQIDAQVAQQLAEKMEQEELIQRQAVEEEDKEIARKLQERERLRIEKRERERLEMEMQESDNDINDPPQYDRDMNNVGLPSPSQYSPEALSQQFRLCTLTDVAVQTNSSCQTPEDAVAGNPPSPPALSEEEARKIQEEQDAEFARLLQEQEGYRQLDMLDQDRLMAIEAQDKELARLLQERERAKAKRARERAKQKALLKKQQQQQQQQQQLLLSDDEGFVASPSAQGHLLPGSEWGDQDGPIAAHSTAIRPTDLDLTSGVNRSATSRGKQRFPDPEAIEVLSSPEPGPSHSALPNIAMAIDPTYPRRATVTHTSTYNTSAVDTPPSNISSPAVSLPPPEFDEDDSPVPPYMPIQGQRRSASLEKKNKKGRSKDSCKQQ
ncbi:coiled-coil domain-containing protein 50 isoform X2 [Periplaneta americana]|uniref:coiled-coil domain-containing protein 50 isoform X2 n=1 Tax=Periplaneta americana TaxID=6978 RepID=UPI0037E96669